MSIENKKTLPEVEREGTAVQKLRSILSGRLFGALLIAAVTLAVFGPVAGFEFINCDDPDYFAANPHVKSGLAFDNVRWAFTTGYAANWHPLTWISLMIDAHVFGPNAWWPHLTNAILHAANAALLFLLLNRLIGKPWRSMVIAVLFALHPTHVESVAWVAERKDVLSTFFGLLALIFYTRYAHRQRASDRANVAAVRASWISPHYWLSVFFFALSLMSKPMLVTMPFLLLLIDYWPLHRIKYSTLLRRPASLIPLGLEKLPFILLSAGSCVVTFLVQRAGKAVADLAHVPVPARIENVLISYARYLGKLIWPSDLAIMYPFPSGWPWAMVVFSAFLLGVLCWAAWANALRRPYLFVGWGWFLGTMVPMIGLVQVGMQSIADRYTYIPSIGIAIAAVWGVNEVVRRWRVPGIVVTVVALAVLAALALQTMAQLLRWQDTETLFRHTLAVTRENTFAHNNLGSYLRMKGRYDEAAEQFEAALKISPDHADVLNNYGYLFAEKKQYDKAIEFYEKALQANREHAAAHENLAEALFKTGKSSEALKEYSEALRVRPDRAESHNRAGVLLASMGRMDEATGHFREALRLNPDFAAAHCNLGTALAAQKRYDEAIAHYRAALRLNPEYAEARNNLGSALEEGGSLVQAIPCYREALRLKPDYAQAHFNLGSALAHLNRRDEAMLHLAEALRLKPDYVKARQELEELNRKPAK